MLEQYEIDDWGTNHTMTNEERQEKSISSYYLTQWYPLVKDLTFETVIFDVNSPTDCPNVLPFEKNMVRYEHKSPSDSPHWGPVSTKQEVLQVFETSLRFRLNGKHGKHLCFRQYHPNLGIEYRCFWNTRLVAVGLQSFDNVPFTKDICHKIINYVEKIKDRIPYHRCVMDIATVGDSFVLIEFNSWETNSGATPFSWIEDTSILYPSKNNNEIVFKSSHETLRVPGPTVSVDRNFLSSDALSRLKVLRPNKPTQWIVHDDYVYITTDIWLGKFTLTLKSINWKRGVYRFSNLYLTKDNHLLIGDELLNLDLKMIRKVSKEESYKLINYEYYQQGDDYIEDLTGKHRYGFYSEPGIFIHLDNDGEFNFLGESC
jgi:hypothetical protein